MNNYNKSEITPAICQSHNGRAERDFRICPSKLSKRELEDLYFTLLENNLELKKTVNNQQDKIRVLSTKVQRVTAVQKKLFAKEPKDCCAHTKAIVNEHKQLIADLKNENGTLTERIRLLNMKLCSAKQFTRRSSAVYASTCAKCSSLLTGKNSSMSVIHSKRSENNLKSATVSSQCVDKDFTTPRISVVVPTNKSREETFEKTCDENKCRNLIEELKHKIEDLQMELSKAHEKDSSRINSLEQEVLELHNENQRVRSECAASQYGQQQREQRAEELATRLRATEAKNRELSAQLSIEKRKVAELETHAEAADLSRSLAKTIDEHITNASQARSEIMNTPTGISSLQPYLSLTCEKSMSNLEVPSKSRKSDAYTDMEDQRTSDDSGYTDVNKSQDDEKDKAMSKRNEELMERINVLQEQLTALQMTAKNVEVNEENLAALADSSVSQLPPTSTPKRTCTPNFSCGSPVISTVDNVRVDNGIVTSPAEGNLESVPFEARYLEEESPKSHVDDDAVIKAEAKSLADSKESQDINSDLQTNPKSATSAHREWDSHNSYQILGSMPVDVEMTKEIRQNEKIAAFKFKQLINAKTKKNEQKRSKGAQRDIELDDDDSAPIKGDRIKEIAHECADESTIVQNKVSRKKHMDKISIKSMNDSKSAGVDATRKSVEEKFNTLGERSINGKRSPPLSVSNVNYADQATAVAEDNLPNTDAEFGTQTETILPKEEPKPVQSSFRRRSATYSKGDTYSLPQHNSRATSPDNTDLEISSLTDLPSEKDAKSPRTLSPGEEKVTTTYTESYTTPTTDYGSLSEGELPATGREQQSIGETKVNFANVPSLTSKRMEETLQAISEELARCKQLLTSQRSTEVKHLIINR